MIISAIFNLIKATILFVIGLFPALPDLSFLAQSIQPFIDLLHGINLFVSVPLLGFCLGVLFVVWNIDFFWSIIMWVVRKIPGVS